MGCGSIEKLRRRIDRIDRRLVSILLRRYAVVNEIGMLKKRHGLQIADVEREREVLENINAWVKNPSACSFIKVIYRTIFRASKKVEGDKSFE